MNRDEAKKFVVATILTGDKERIKKVIDRYWTKYEKKKEPKGQKKLFDN